jgi:beta-fructofuranosidase
MPLFIAAIRARSVSTGTDQSFTLDLIVKDDLVDACIDNRRTIITRNHAKLTGDRLFFFANHGEVSFEDVRVQPLLEE